MFIVGSAASVGRRRFIIFVALVAFELLNRLSQIFLLLLCFTVTVVGETSYAIIPTIEKVSLLPMSRPTSFITTTLGEN